MQAMREDDDDRDIDAGSQDGSSDNDMDETMRDVDDAEAEGEPDADADPDADPESPGNSSQGSDGATQQNPEARASPSPARDQTDPLLAFRPSVRPEALTASTYDIAPTTAAPHSTSINAIAATADMRWVFSGGSDGYTRKFNWVDSINSKLMLTVAQRHPFVDSVVKAGVLMTYWENMDGNAVSPVYSLACQSQGLWLLSGLESGNIRLQSTRHDEGKEIALLQEHTSAVSVMALTSDEKTLLSGSWDKKVLDWDLNVGQSRRMFGSSARQVSAIQIRPLSTLPVPPESGDIPITNGTFSSNTLANGSSSFGFQNEGGDGLQGQSGSGNQNAASPTDSLFGGADSLFGDGDGGAPSGGAFAVDEDDEFSRAVANGIQHPDEDAPGEAEETGEQNGMTGGPPPTREENPAGQSNDVGGNLPNGISEPVVNGLPHAEELGPSAANQEKFDASMSDSNITSDTTFLAASIDGTIRVWDRRQPEPVARIIPRNVPPWCMNACWSPDGNYIYAGRRNGTVEEYSLHKGLRNAERTFRFPQGSGSVTALQAMPNGRHLVCASHDILRLYDLKNEQSARPSTVPFLIVPGHRTGVVSQLYVDPACRYMISTGGNRGWEGATTEVLLGYEIGVPG